MRQKRRKIVFISHRKPLKKEFTVEAVAVEKKIPTGAEDGERNDGKPRIFIFLFSL